MHTVFLHIMQLHTQQIAACASVTAGAEEPAHSLAFLPAVPAVMVRSCPQGPEASLTETAWGATSS